MGARRAYDNNDYFKQPGGQPQVKLVIQKDPDIEALDQFAASINGKPFWLLHGQIIPPNQPLRAHFPELYTIIEHQPLTRDTALLYRPKTL